MSTQGRMFSMSLKVASSPMIPQVPFQLNGASLPTPRRVNYGHYSTVVDWRFSFAWFVGTGTDVVSG